MKPLHEELKELRLEQKLTLKQVAGKTRIRHDFLERLEAGDYTVAPMPFVRAFFREYAEVVGADPTLVMAKLDKKIDTILAPKPAEPPEPSGSDIIAEGIVAAPDDDSSPKTPESDVSAPESDVEVPAEDDTVSADGNEDDTESADDDEDKDAQASLFDDSGEADVDVADEETEIVSEEVVTNKTSPVTESPETETVYESATIEQETEAQAETTWPEDEAVSYKSSAAHDDTGEHIEIELDVNGNMPDTVRRPLVIEEESSLSNIVFTVIVIAILIVAGVLVFLNRGSLF